MPKQVWYNLWPTGLRGGVWFLLKSNPVFLPRDIPWAGRSALKQYPPPRGGIDSLLGLYSNILHKKLIFLEILEKYSTKTTLWVKKWLPFFLVASRRQWEGPYRRSSQISKAALGRPKRKCRNSCGIAFGLGARGEELGFSLKVTLFLSLGTSHGWVGVRDGKIIWV